MSGGGGHDIFDMFFNRGGGGRARKQQKPQLKPTVKEAKITLYDAYHGKMLHVNVQRKCICADCNGMGGSKVDQCMECKGRGVVTKMVQLGPGMYSQSQSYCTSCDGNGEQISKKDICKTCKGAKLIKKNEKVEVPVEVGFPAKGKIQIREKGNEHPDARTGDLIVVITVEDDKNFKRVNDDLYITKKIGLIDSLTGVKFNLEHLNDHKITIQTPENKIIKHKEILRVPNLGMPHYKDRMSNGDLYVEFDVVTPKTLNQE